MLGSSQLTVCGCGLRGNHRFGCPGDRLGSRRRSLIGVRAQPGWGPRPLCMRHQSLPPHTVVNVLTAISPAIAGCLFRPIVTTVDD